MFLNVTDEIEVVADQILIVPHKEAVAVDRRVRRGIEGVGLAVIPVALGAVIVSLVLDGDVVGDLQFKAAA